uniref:Protein-serine/threonine phosphatase n=1 Tax=Steinernema glaseri TaxID=37863 RepID=A0A1I7ZCE6_9BILA
MGEGTQREKTLSAVCLQVITVCPRFIAFSWAALSARIYSRLRRLLSTYGCSNETFIAKEIPPGSAFWLTYGAVEILSTNFFQIFFCAAHPHLNSPLDE